MVSASPEAAAEESKDALKTVYQVVAGLAITEALTRSLLDNGSFIGTKIVDPNNLCRIIVLLAVFLPTISRFVHGASVHLVTCHSPSKPDKVVLDYCFFLLQGCAFYIMALLIKDLDPFLWSLVFVLGFDVAWLIVMRVSRNITSFGYTEMQWLISDALMGVIMAGLIYFNPSPLLKAGIAGIVGLIATACDYRMNRNFYFPPPAPPPTPPASEQKPDGTGSTKVGMGGC